MTHAMRLMSDAARSIDVAGRVAVDMVNAEHYLGRMPSDAARNIYLACVEHEIHRRMAAELAPFQRLMMRMTTMRALPEIEPPPELAAATDAIIGKWRQIAEELVPSGR